MQALILNGARTEHDGLDPLAMLLSEVLGARGFQVDRLSLRHTTLAPCRGCFQCWTHTPGLCATQDEGNDIARAFLHHD
ncbi:MAG: hypothetical protein AAFS10_26295, partial [Myxococcota bacterium]